MIESVLTTWTIQLKWTIRQTKGKTSRALLFKISYTEFIYYIWMEHNQRVFEKKRRTAKQVTREIVYSCYVRAPPRLKVVTDRPVVCP